MSEVGGNSEPYKDVITSFTYWGLKNEAKRSRVEHICSKDGKWLLLDKHVIGSFVLQVGERNDDFLKGRIYDFEHMGRSVYCT